MYTLMSARAMSSMKSSAKYMQLLLCSILAYLNSEVSFANSDRHVIARRSSIASVLAPTLVELAKKVTAIDKTDLGRNETPPQLPHLRAQYSPPHPTQPHIIKSSYTASLCILLRLIRPRNLANRLPGPWYL